MGVVSTNTMVAGTNASGFVGFIRNQAGSMSPTTTDAFGVSPTIDYLFYEFFFMTIQFVGHLDNSSITGMTVTPAGGSTTTITFTSYVWDSNNNMTRFSDSVGTYPAFVSGTTYTVQLLGTTTDMNTEGTTLERRNPKDMNDFYGATRNVPPVSGAFKLSWLKNAVKYQFSASMTAGKYTAGFPANFTIRGYHIAFSIGSMTATTLSGLINTYNGNTIISISETFDQASTSYLPTLIINTGPNSQWYKLQIGSASFYREDATFSANPNSPYWTTFSWNTGSTQNIVENNTYAIKLTC